MAFGIATISTAAISALEEAVSYEDSHGFFQVGATAGATGNAWAAPSNALTDNGSNATQTPGTGTAQDYLWTTDADWTPALPANIMVVGLQVLVRRLRSGGTTGEVRDQVLQLLKAGVATGNNNADTGTNWPTSEAEATYGVGFTDMWGATWSRDDLMHPSFGVQLRAVNVGGGADRVAEVDLVEAIVYYIDLTEVKSKVTMIGAVG